MLLGGVRCQMSDVSGRYGEGIWIGASARALGPGRACMVNYLAGNGKWAIENG